MDNNRNNKSNTITNDVRNIISSYKHTPSNVYNRRRRKEKQPKRLPVDITVYSEPEKNEMEFNEKELTKIGVGNIVLYENQDEAEVLSAIGNLIQSFDRIDMGVEDIIPRIRFFRRDGKTKRFTPHVKGPGFSYNGMGIKDLRPSKDSKKVYLYLKGHQKKRSALPSFLSSTYDDTNIIGSSDSDLEDHCTSTTFSNDIRFVENTPIRSAAAKNFGQQKEKSLKARFEKNIKIKRKVSSLLPDHGNLYTVLVMLNHLKPFKSTVELIAKDNSNISNLDQILIQFQALIGNDDVFLWKMLFEDLEMELGTNRDTKVKEIFEIIVVKLKETEIWKTGWFDECFLNTLIKEYYSHAGNDSIENKDQPYFEFDIPEESSSLNETLKNFVSSKEEVTEIPDNVLYLKGEGNMVWARNYFLCVPDVFILSPKQCTKKIKDFKLPETFPQHIVEDIRSTNCQLLHLTSIVVEIDGFCYTIGPSYNSKWSIFYDGFEFSVENVSDLFQEIPDAILVLVVYSTDDKITSLDKATDEFIISADFLLKRMMGRKRMHDQTVEETPKVARGSLLQLTEKINYRIRKINGQSELKKKLSEIARRAIFDKRRGGAQNMSRLHMIFRGNPGTGKTMAARAVAGIMFDIGLANSEKVVEVQRVDLVADHIGGTAKKTNAAIEKAMNGVLFIDEAYTLSTASEKDFGKEAIETLMSVMNAHPNDAVKYPMLIFAGYNDEMEKFVTTNPGLARRIKTTLTFKDYTCAELAQIVTLKLIEKKMKFPLNVEQKFTQCFYKLSEQVRSKYNGALCEDVIDSIQTSQEERLDPETSSKSDLFEFSMTDVEKGIERFLAGFEEKKSSMVSVGCQTPEVIMNVPNVGIVFGSP